jgi:hypothetical protein
MRQYANGVPTSLQVKVGHPVKTTAKVAQDECCDMIALSAPYHEYIHSQYHGRLADSLIRIAPCPVLCLHQSPYQAKSERILGNLVPDELELQR